MLYSRLVGRLLVALSCGSVVFGHNQRDFERATPRALIDALPPPASWGSIALNIGNDAAIQDHVEGFANVFRYIQYAERNSRLDIAALRTGLSAAILAALDSAAKMDASLGPNQVKFRKDFEEAVSNSLSTLGRSNVVEALSPILPAHVLKDALHQMYEEIVWASETAGEARDLVKRFVAWLNYWREEIQEMDDYALRRIVNRHRHIHHRAKRIAKHMRKFRRGITTGSQNREQHYLNKLVNDLSSDSAAFRSSLLIPAVSAVGVLLALL